ncbi:MAG: agmatine deiminase [Candidatus Tectimicrobiota bacterium]|nr:MAG: agmatine deiminase [Candidatus Tectomicrobia bacterium]
MPSLPPVAYGYRMPAEWEPHSATWLAWPHNRDNWEAQLEPVQALFLRLIAVLQAHETVHLLVNDAATEAHVRQRLAALGCQPRRLVCHRLPTVDVWLRDSGPTFVTAPHGLAAVAWRFNAWGGKYADMMADAALAPQIAARLGVPCFTPEVVLEGGAIDVDGCGSALATEQCLLHPNRNPHLARRELEGLLHAYLGVRRLIWLGQGLAGDDTDGHVDNIARFVAPATVVCALATDPRDENFAALQDNYRRLQAATDAAGRPLRVVPLPLPAPRYAEDLRLPASYLNFYLANRLVLVPTYDDPQDAVALATLQRLFPERRVLGLPCLPLVWGQGALHCVTQQQPAV